MNVSLMSMYVNSECKTLKFTKQIQRWKKSGNKRHPDGEAPVLTDPDSALGLWALKSTSPLDEYSRHSTSAAHHLDSQRTNSSETET